MFLFYKQNINSSIEMVVIYSFQNMYFINNSESSSKFNPID